MPTLEHNSSSHARAALETDSSPATRAVSPRVEIEIAAREKCRNARKKCARSARLSSSPQTSVPASCARPLHPTPRKNDLMTTKKCLCAANPVVRACLFQRRSGGPLKVVTNRPTPWVPKDVHGMHAKREVKSELYGLLDIRVCTKSESCYIGLPR